ncbi:unnamed protein product [Nezara viridula]|uniref:Uncharacterized protein n=1 Tax=Nezara viridula TaxID=85310 RepID=A0A9P0HUQ5_NEZVI|nr:unnamed protein product [Nezara viridula]
MDKMNSILYDMCRLRENYDSKCIMNKMESKIKFSFGYNEGRNRRELLAMFPKEIADVLASDEDSYISSSYKSSILDDNPLTIDFLRSHRRKEFSGKFFLDLRGNEVEKNLNRRLNDSDLDFLFDFIEKRPTICGLHLPYNNITNHGFAKLSDFLAYQGTIKYVNIMNNEITYLDQKKLGEAIGKWKVQCLNLRGNKIGRKGGETIAYLLTKNSTLKHVALGETDQTVNSVISIADALIQFGGNNTLTKLDLTKSLLTTNVGELCRHLACVLEVNRTIAELVLSKNNISDLDLEILLEGFKHQHVLSRLNLSCNHISSHGAELIANILPQAKLKLLVLATNIINDSGAMALGRVFSFSKLTFLDVSMNHISDLGMTHLVWAICRPMDGFFIHGNKFTEYTAKVIHSQCIDLALDPKTLDIRLWFDDTGSIHYTRRNLWRYSDWYYYVPEWKKNDTIQHCCCPFRGGIMVQLQSDD